MQNFMSIEEFLSLPEDRQILKETLDRLSFETLCELAKTDGLSANVKGVIDLRLYRNGKQPAAQTHYQQPHQQAPHHAVDDDLPKYPILKIISKVLIALGWILIGAAAIYLLVLLFKIIVGDYYWSITEILVQMPIPLAIAILGVFHIAGAEIIKVFTDISRNTATIIKRLDGK